MHVKIETGIGSKIDARLGITQEIFLCTVYYIKIPKIPSLVRVGISRQHTCHYVASWNENNVQCTHLQVTPELCVAIHSVLINFDFQGD